MSLIQLIVAFGVAAGLLAVLVVVVFEAVRKRMEGKNAPFVPKTFVGGLGIAGVAGPAGLIARRGQNESPRMTLNTVIMTPTRGLRFISLLSSALMLLAIWTPAMRTFNDGDLTLHVIATIAIAYGALFISSYEARYNADGITAPNWFFQAKHFPWEAFISVKDDGHHLYRLRFDTGMLYLQKHLVGMPTFLTFISEIRELNKRR